MGNNSFRCMHCGDEYKLDMSNGGLKTWEFSALANGYEKEHANCQEDKDAIADRFKANSPLEWLHGLDTGVSSETIYSVMTGHNVLTCGEGDAPHDPGDFGRCYRLLKLFPEWRERLAEVVLHAQRRHLPRGRPIRSS